MPFYIDMIVNVESTILILPRLYGYFDEHLPITTTVCWYVPPFLCPLITICNVYMLLVTFVFSCVFHQRHYPQQYTNYNIVELAIWYT